MILSPTRELAIQTKKHTNLLCAGLGLKVQILTQTSYELEAGVEVDEEDYFEDLGDGFESDGEGEDEDEGEGEGEGEEAGRKNKKGKSVQQKKQAAKKGRRSVEEIREKMAEFGMVANNKHTLTFFCRHSYLSAFKTSPSDKT